MISEKLYKKIENEGRKNGFKIYECYGERDKKGYFSFVIRLVPIDERAKPVPQEQTILETIHVSGKRIDPDAIRHLTS